MASRARDRRQHRTGYRFKPSKSERKELARRTRHQAHQTLSTVVDPDELVVPEVTHVRSERTATNEIYRDRAPEMTPAPSRGVRKTAFWKRRASWRRTRAELDAAWPVEAALEAKRSSPDPNGHPPAA